MRILVLSDIHANREALEAVLADAAGHYDQTVCCGDLVGYNADPGWVVEWNIAQSAVTVRGNHDKAVAGLISLEWFNDVAEAATLWTRTQLNQPQIGYLRALPSGPMSLDGLQLLHGATFDEDEYVLDTDTALRSMRLLDGQLAFFGHTHVQGGFMAVRQHAKTVKPVAPAYRSAVIELEPDVQYLINPGSVGQPRDRDPRAAYALYNPALRIVELRRVEYSIQAAAEKIKEAGLPEVLGLRLFQGV